MGAVSICGDCATACYEVVAIDVIDIAVAIVINTRSTTLFGLVDPHIGLKVGVVSHNATIKHCYNNAVVASCVLPGVE